MEFTIAIINYGTADLVKSLLSSLVSAKVNSTDDNVLLKEVLVVDSGFPDVADAAQLLDTLQCPWPVRVITNPGHSYSSGVNKALANATR